MVIISRFISGRAARNTARLRLESLEIRANPSTLTVDDDRVQFPTAGFTSIQAAVNAASAGDSIRVYPGTYHEQVIIPSKLNNLDLRAVGGPDQAVIAPTSFAADASEAVVRVAGAHNVSLRGFLITGTDAPAGGGAGANYGVLIDTGGSADVTSNHITTIRDLPLTGTQEGIGIQYGFTNSKGTVLSTATGSATTNVIEDYQKGGIVVIGAGSNADLERNTTVGSGATSVIAQNGIQVSDGATALLDRNTVSGNKYTGGGVVATGILIFHSNAVTIDRNTVFDNDEGVLLWFSDKSAVTRNSSNGNTHNGIALFESDGNTITSNDVRNNKLDGINIDTSNDNDIEKNSAFFNLRYAIALEATSTGNVVTQNHLGGNVAGNIFVGNPNNTVEKNHFS